MASYDVEEILDTRKKSGKNEYLVRWAPTWELEKNLNCAKLLKDFKAKNKNEENGDQNEDNDEEDDEQTDEEEANTSKRGTPRKAAKAGNRKRKAAQKSGPKRSKRRR